VENYLNKTKRRYRPGRTARVLAAFAMALSLFGLPGPCGAAEPSGQPRPDGVREVLASVTVLSEAAMSRENATGAQPAQIIGAEPGHLRVMLWDELKTQPELPAGTNGTVSLSVSGGK
jgi:hypothetical protein